MKNRKIANNIISAWFLLMIALIFASIVPTKIPEFVDTIKNRGITTEYSGQYESSINNSFPLKNYFVDINGLFHRMVLQREMNKVLLLSNGHEEIPIVDVTDEGIAANADSMQQFSQWLENRGINFLYCQVPRKIDVDNNLLPSGKVDYSNRIADAFLEDLEIRGVNHLDLREKVKEDNVDLYSLFLKTDHHWTPEGGFYAFQKICDELRTRFGEEIPEYVTDIRNYTIETYEGSSLGYNGQRTGWMFGGFDDFSLIYPAWETRQNSYAPHKDLYREGSFYDAVFYTEYLDNNWRERNLYGTYIGGDWPLVIHHSETAPIDKTVMILIDSYGTIPESFLTTAYKNVIGVDLRWVLLNQLGKTTVEFVEEYKPDIVIIAFNPNQIGYPESEQFQYGLEY